MKFFVKVAKSAKSGNPYLSLWVDFGYRKTVVCFDGQLCAEMLQRDYDELIMQPIGTKFEVDSI